MSTELTWPRTVYRGPTDERAETKRAESADDFDAKAGWRLKRNPKNEARPADAGQITLPAQTIQTDPGKAKDGAVAQVQAAIDKETAPAKAHEKAKADEAAKVAEDAAPNAKRGKKGVKK